MCPTEKEAATVVSDLSFFCSFNSGNTGSPKTIVQLPEWNFSPYAGVSSSDTNTSAAAILSQYTNATSGVLVSSVAALMRRVVDPKLLTEHSITISKSQPQDRDLFVHALSKLGYRRATLVTQKGQFSVRGGLVDCFPAHRPYPLRIEWFGDTIETIREFTPETQRSIMTPSGVVPSAVDLAKAEVTPSGVAKAEFGLSSINSANAPDDTQEISSVSFAPSTEMFLSSPTAKTDFFAIADACMVPSKLAKKKWADLENNVLWPGIDCLLPIFHGGLHDPIDSVAVLAAGKAPPSPVQWIVLQPTWVAKVIKDTWADVLAEYNECLTANTLACPPTELFTLPEKLLPFLQKDDVVALSALQKDTKSTPSTSVPPLSENKPSAEVHSVLPSGFPSLRTLRTTLSNSPHGEHSAKILRDTTSAWLVKDWSVVIVCDSERRRRTVMGFWQDTGIAITQPSAPAPNTPGVIQCVAGRISEGFMDSKQRTVWLASSDIFGSSTPKRQRRKRHVPKSFTQSVVDFSQIETGGLLVHKLHGVGSYQGLTSMTAGGSAGEFVQLQYTGGNLYLPVYRVNEIERFVGPETKRPPIDTLGGSSWIRSKQKAKKDIEAVAEALLQMYAQRESVDAQALLPPDDDYFQFCAEFPYEETPDQQTAIDDVHRDLEKSRPMDRVICGDVGFGKTEVAIRAILRMCLSGRQSVLLAPTTILVEQHYRTLRDRYQQWPIRVAKLSRFVSKSVANKTLEELSQGRIDVVVGTHRLLSRDVELADLGLLVIDEEQRFGVLQKERLRSLRSRVHSLSMSATPIPRTLHMALGGIKDLSLITTAPSDRLEIRTHVGETDTKTIYKAIAYELARQGKVFFVVPTIQAQRKGSLSLEEWQKHLRSLFPQVTIDIGHGRMRPKQLEKVMVDFTYGNTQILISTTIVENGLDIPQANTMVVVDADQFGLSQLYQLRGRVGRSSRRGHCHLLIAAFDALTKDSRKRLEAMQRHTTLGSGFNIASQDLEIRGAGELLGHKQSGSVSTIGLGQYSRMLRQAVAQLRGQPIEEPSDIELLCDIPSYIPQDYISDPGLRLSAYQRLARAKTTEELDTIVEEYADTFGTPPDTFRTLTLCMHAKNLARKFGAKRIELAASSVTLTMTTIDTTNTARRDKADTADTNKKLRSFGRCISAGRWRHVYATPFQESPATGTVPTKTNPADTVREAISVLEQLNA